MARKNALLADELAAMDGVDPDMDAPREMSPAPTSAPPPPDPVVAPLPSPAPVGVSPDIAALATMLAQAMSTNASQQQEMLAALLQQNATTVAKIARDRKPENQDYPDVSVFNPYGERDHPRPELPKLFVGQRHPETGAIERLLEEDREMLDYDACLFLRALQPSDAGTVTLMDERDVRVEVAQVTSPTGRVEQTVICVPYGLLSKDNSANKNAWCGVKRAAMQLLGPTRVAEVLAADAEARAAKAAA